MVGLYPSGNRGRNTQWDPPVLKKGDIMGLEAQLIYKHFSADTMGIFYVSFPFRKPFCCSGICMANSDDLRFLSFTPKLPSL